MSLRARTLLAAALLLAAPIAAHADLASYSQNFESLTMADPAALANDGWLVYGNVFSPDPARTWLYGYGAFPAPNGGNAFSAIVAGQGGAEQGAQQLSIYNDYNNPDHGIARWIEANVFQEQVIGAGDVGESWTFQFDAKLGNLVTPPSTAIAFIKTLDPAAGWATTHFIWLEMTFSPATWNTVAITIPDLAPELVGQHMQFGFASTTTGYVSSGMFYDNIVWGMSGTTGVGDPAGPRGLELRPAAPNPFSASTRLEWTLPQAGAADVSIYDIGGRRMATLFHGAAEAGPHAAIWDGRAADGSRAPAGVYRAVVQTAAGRVTRNVVLTR